MAAVTEYPKSGGDVYFAEDVNKGNYSVFSNFEQETVTIGGATGSIVYDAERDYHIIQNIGSNSVFLGFQAGSSVNTYELQGYDIECFELNATYISTTPGGSTTIKFIGQN